MREDTDQKTPNTDTFHAASLTKISNLTFLFKYLYSAAELCRKCIKYVGLRLIVQTMNLGACQTSMIKAFCENG